MVGRHVSSHLIFITFLSLCLSAVVEIGRGPDQSGTPRGVVIWIAEWRSGLKGSEVDGVLVSLCVLGSDDDGGGSDRCDSEVKL
jgi:hypothetical protein